MIVEQAIFGEARGGHALKLASGDSAAATLLAPRLDLPDTAPSGVEWSPFILGFPHLNSFVFARTFHDSAAPRAGMVLSHALIVPTEEIIYISNLRPVFNHFIIDTTLPVDVKTLNIEPTDEEPPDSTDLQSAAAAFSTRAEGPVVRVGVQGFEELVVSLWGRLWPSLRRNFSFRLSFGPADLVETPQPILVCTPSSLVARWRGHRLLETSDSKSTSLVASMLSGRSEGDALLAFAHEIGANLTSFNELPLLEQAYRLAVLEPDSIGNTVAAVRLTELLSPDSMRGKRGKARLLDHMVLHLNRATANDILQLRNLSLQGFEHANRMWTGIADWLAENDFPESQDNFFRSIITDATETLDSTEDWRKAILDGLSGATQARGLGFASAFWRWAAARSDAIGPLWSFINRNSDLEGRLVNAAPHELTPEVARPILERARAQHLYRLHGATASAAYGPVEAVRLQVAIEPLPGADGVQLALSSASPSEILFCALEVGDSRIIRLAAEHVTKTPTLLASVDLSGETARAIWSISLEHDLESWRGPANPRAAFEGILIDVLNGRPFIPELVNSLSLTPLADMTSFARREELWSKVTGSARDLLIRATARGWLRKVAEDNFSATKLEPELQTVVLRDPKLDELLAQFQKGRIGVAVSVVAQLSTFDEYRFRTWLRTAASRTHSIPPADTEAIGRLTQERRWRHVCDDLLDMLHRGREDIRPALRNCVSLIGRLERWRYGLSPISRAEKWESLNDVAAELYPMGPDQDGLWERAGGQSADLNQTASGRAQWRGALDRIRHGGNRPRIGDLLREIRNDYPANSSVRFLSDDREFLGY